MPSSVYDPLTGTISEGESKWFVPEDRLNPDQKRFLRDVDINQHNIWIKGFAGSGKSILLVHVARKILAARPNARIALVVYTQSLVEMFKKALKELTPPLNIPVQTEVQDLTPRVLSRMYERSAHLVVAGDSNQSIYPEDPRWREKTVDVSQIPTLIHGNDFELTIVERLTQSVMNAVKSFLRLNIFGTRVNLNRVDTRISLCKANSSSAEIAHIIQNSTRVIKRGYTAAILIPTQRSIVDFVNSALSSLGKPIWNSTTNAYGKVDFGAMNAHLSRCGVKMQYVGNGYGEFRSNPDYVVLMTYHSSKGLDFDYVYIPFCSDRLWISYNEALSKTLFMVAMTRARMNLNITYTGSLHSYVQPFANTCESRSI